jgi:hypothetical protein
MSDKKRPPGDPLEHKVINIFQRHRRGEHFHFEVEEGGELIISPDGFNYVSFKTAHVYDSDSDEALQELANKKHYLVKILEHHREASRVNNYYVPGERLEEFLLSLPHRPGKILEIQQVIPNTTA